MGVGTDIGYIFVAHRAILPFFCYTCLTIDFRIFHSPVFGSVRRCSACEMLESV